MQSKILTEKNLKKTCFLQGKILRKAFFLLQEQMKNTNVVLDTELIITSRVNYSLGSGPMQTQAYTVWLQTFCGIHTNHLPDEIQITGIWEWIDGFQGISWFSSNALSWYSFKLIMPLMTLATFWWLCCFTQKFQNWIKTLWCLLRLILSNTNYWHMICGKTEN